MGTFLVSREAQERVQRVRVGESRGNEARELAEGREAWKIFLRIQRWLCSHLWNF